MRALMSILGGFVLVLAVFSAGAAMSFTMFAPKPNGQPHPGGDSSVLWTAEPRKVDPNSVQLERLAAVERPESAGPTVSEGAGIDRTVAAAIAPREEPQLSEAHIDWCSSRFRSYNPDTNSYRAYSGQSKTCVSPYGEEKVERSAGRVLAKLAGSTETERPQGLVGYAEQADASLDMSADHVRSCFSRYRSYRPEDNTYQPWRGGPRQQCM